MSIRFPISLESDSETPTQSVEKYKSGIEKALATREIMDIESYKRRGEKLGVRFYSFCNEKANVRLVERAEQNSRLREALETAKRSGIKLFVESIFQNSAENGEIYINVNFPDDEIIKFILGE